MADVGVVKTVTDGSTTHVPGGQISYTLTVTNDGPSVAVDTVVTDTLPTDATVVATTPGGPTCSELPPRCSPVIWVTWRSVPSRSVTVVVAIDADSTASQTNVATVTSDTPDPDSSNNVSTVSTTAAPEADLSLVKTGPATYVPGETVTYTLTATNNGPSQPVTGIVDRHAADRS